MKKGISLILIVFVFVLFLTPEFLCCEDLAYKIELQENIENLDQKDPQAQNDAEEKGKKFFSLGFGYAIGITVYRQERKSIREAAIVNGIVRIMEEESTGARLMLESHYFFPFPLQKEKIGIGPFLALEISGKQFSKFGAGIMVGFRYNTKTTKSFNIGIGWFHDSNFKKLGDGLNRNQPAPTGEYVIRYKLTGWDGPLFIFSFSF